jgi:hypothetical protein
MVKKWGWTRHYWAINFAVVGIVIIGTACGGSDTPSQSVEASPTVTATPTATLTAAQRYETELVAVQSAYAEELQGIEDLVRTSNVQSSDWLRLYRAAFERLAALEDRVNAMQPPTCYAAVHEELVQAARSYRAAGGLVTLALNTGQANDASLRFVPGLRMNEGATHMNEAKRLARTVQC